MKQRPVVAIVGGGFAGLSAARALAKAPVEVVLIDRANHHLHQPLLYLVATSVLTPGQIASPLRSLLGRQQNTTVVLGEVTGVETQARRVRLAGPGGEGQAISYDYLILATGASHSYFSNPEFAKYAPGLKSLSDAVLIRNRILQAFERAEAEAALGAKGAAPTFVLVGAGPAGVEMAAAIAVLVRNTLRGEFRRIDPVSARIVLMGAADRVLAGMSVDLSQAAEARLRELGVEVRLAERVEKIDETGVTAGGERIAAAVVIWTAGVMPSPAGKWLNAETDKAGRVQVQPDLTVAGHSEILVIGDTATLEQDGKALPGVVQAAIQQGRYAASVIDRRSRGKRAQAPFRYSDKGTMAVVGLGYSVLQMGSIRLRGFIAWLVWASVHILSLAQTGMRVSVFMQASSTYWTGQRGSRLIVRHQTAEEAEGAR